MIAQHRWKLLIFIGLIALSAWLLLPSVRLYGMPENERYGSDATVTELRSKSVSLGLDLLGGMHMVLQMDREQLTDEQIPDAMDRAMEVFRNRIDEFGVAEPTIQKQGADRIQIQLPGLVDQQRARDLLGQTAVLEFKLVQRPEKIRSVIDRLDRSIASALRNISPDDSLAADSLLTADDRPLRSVLYNYPNMANGPPMVTEGDLVQVQKYLKLDAVVASMPEDSEIAFESQPKPMGNGLTGYSLYVLKSTAEMTGEAIKNAQLSIGLDPTRPSAAGVSMTMNAEGTNDFRRVTGKNVGRQLAIVLDGKVASAPSIQGRIPHGNASITGTFTDQQAGDLAIVLRAGALPAPMNIIEERTVGPSLGRDSVRTGVNAALIGAVSVMIFMLFYYRASGLIAIFGLMVNLFFLGAGLAALKATLTLPGIAGIVLTIGMAVDANVLIFERIREELRTGVRPSLAIDAGYDRAFTTILDANLTTLISAVVLYWFGTGPIKGFAVTLAIGIIANLYTAVIITRMVFDFVAGNRSLKKLSI